jgi:mono/diheme cytochrome c family protein
LRTSEPTAARRARTALGRAWRAAAVLLAIGLLASGCEGSAATREATNAGGGKKLFTQKCGSCHAMEDAGSNGELGPNLDDAFGYPRSQGFDESTFYQITLDQMRIPAPPMPDFDDGKEKLSEEELQNIAHYVALCAGLGDEKRQDCTGPAEGPQAVFAASCGSCHTFAAAGTNGTTGPNLDESDTSLEEAIKQIAEGGGGMPAFEDDLSEEEIRALADYVVKNRNRGS